MKKIRGVLLAPDSFKGTLTAEKFCEIFAEVIKEATPEVEVYSYPLADGGEGTTGILAANWGVQLQKLEVTGPYFTKVEGFYALAGKRAGIEMACCAGLPLVGDALNPALTTTYGVGELILAAVNKGAREILLCLGGSCTNDGGCGMLAALGVKFFRADGSTFVPVGGNLNEIVSISTEEMLIDLKEVKFKLMCDVTNPLFGSQGAAYIFAPQKGADQAMVQLLDDNLRHLAKVVTGTCGLKGFEDLAGAGAAGGMGYGACAFLKGELASGITTVLQAINLAQDLPKVELVITGEGKLDTQSLGGKVIAGLSDLCKVHGKPLVVVAGAVDLAMEEISGAGLQAAFSINRAPKAFAEVKDQAESNLRFFAENFWRLLQLKF